MEFDSVSEFVSMPLFGQAGEELSLWDADLLQLKRSPEHDSEGEMEPSPSPTWAADSSDLARLLDEAGITLDDDDTLNIPAVSLPETLPETVAVSDIDMPVMPDVVSMEDYQESEAPSSPFSNSDAESRYTPSPAPTRSSRGRRVKVIVPAITEEDEEGPKRNKAAQQAKINREKKKAYIAELESRNEVLAKENKELKVINRKVTSEKESLETEIQYLRSVLANQSTLSKLLQNIPDVKGVRLTTSFSESRKRSADLDHDYGPGKRSCSSATATAPSGGVCLHVAGSEASLEFCMSCANSAGQKNA